MRPAALLPPRGPLCRRWSLPPVQVAGVSKAAHYCDYLSAANAAPLPARLQCGETLWVVPGAQVSIPQGLGNLASVSLGSSD